MGTKVTFRSEDCHIGNFEIPVPNTLLWEEPIL